MRVFTIEDPVFKTEPLYIVGCTFEALKHYMLKRFRVRLEYDGEAWAGSMLTFDVAPWRLVWVWRVTDLPAALHETFHLVTRICQDRNIKVVARLEDDTCGDEAAAYLFEHFARVVIRRMRA